MVTAEPADLATGNTGIADIFADDCRRGRVIGKTLSGGKRRAGIDVEGVLSIDNGALRIQPLIQPGWARAGISYGAWDRRNGLAFAVYMLNGHNTAQSENLQESFHRRVHRWWIGSEAWSPARRALQWLRSPRKGRQIREFLWWWHINIHRPAVPRIDENLAVGWFSREVPADPLKDGNAFVMHATGAENGELWCRTGSSCLPVVRGVQNLPIYYVVVLREKGAAYYAASVADANGLGAYPNLRLLAIDPFETASPVHPGFFQSTLGQIGFRLDTRVYNARVDYLPHFSAWYGSAHAADAFDGAGGLDRSTAEVGGAWRTDEGGFLLGQEGLRPSSSGGNRAILDPGSSSGLVHVLCTPGDADCAAGLTWRYRDQRNFWQFLLAGSRCELAVMIDGAQETIAAEQQAALAIRRPHSIQILDDGAQIGVSLDGQLLFGRRFSDRRLADATGAGILASGDITLSRFEAHPRQVALPAVLDCGKPWLRKGERVVVADDFSGKAGSLAGRKTPVGQKVWSRDIGVGTMTVTDGAVKIEATAQQPNPGRTAYMFDWDNPDFADVQVSITPAGTGPGQQEHALCGLILWQDEDNYITINIWRSDLHSASVSCFFQIDGFENLYDAIWSNIGSRVLHGVPVDMRIAFDGLRYMVFLDEEPVVYRALTDVYPDCRVLSINRVGLLANWEWGNDTGSVFRNFVGRV
jgi:hypothetical protein